MSSPGSVHSPKSRERLFFLLLVAMTAVLAVTTLSAVLEASGGPAVPLDDAYIHFQYARSIAELHPFRYTAGAVPTPGATSLLWPLVLSLFYACGLRGTHVIFAAWALGFASLPLLAWETRWLARGLVGPMVACAAAVMTIAFGGNAWFAASGMEVIPFAWLITRTVRRAIEWVEREPSRPPHGADSSPTFLELMLLVASTCLMRPEGAAAAGMVAVALAYRPHEGRRALALVPLLGPLLPLVVCRLATGQAVTSTAVAKWLPLNPYYPSATLISAVEGNIGIFFGTLLDGRLWTSAFLPSGGRAIAIAALAAVPALGARRHRMPRALGILALALCALIPTTYETFLVNRVRYIWPFAAAWFVALCALSETVGLLVDGAFRALGARVSGAAVLLAGIAVGLLASRLPPSIEDLATASYSVTAQQVALADWARDSLPEQASIGVNDTGAVAYFSGHPTFDVVGLTTAGEARFWTAGVGSRFEHYERLPASRLPSYFIVYPEWFGLDLLLGDELLSRTVHHTILGGATMAGYRARYDLLHSGDFPLDAPIETSRLVDVLDVADLDDEATHHYALLDATARMDTIVAGSDRADGGRASREQDRFDLELNPGGVLVARWGAANPARLEVRVDEREVGAPGLEGTAWQEVVVPIPANVTPGMHHVRVSASSGGAFTSLHYWSYR